MSIHFNDLKTRSKDITAPYSSTPGITQIKLQAQNVTILTNSPRRKTQTFSDLNKLLFGFEMFYKNIYKYSTYLINYINIYYFTS